MFTKSLSKTVAALLILPLTGTAANAAICPAIGASSGCSVVITRSAAGNYSVALTGVGPYDGSDNSLVGFVNNGPDSVAALTLSGSDIFGFDGDGQVGYSGGGNYGPTGYEGPGTSFSVADADHGRVSFTTPIASGGTAWFALESNLATAGGAPITVSGTPEPESWALLLVGFGAVGATLRRRSPRVVAA